MARVQAVGSVVLITFTADGAKLLAAATTRLVVLSFSRSGLAICVDGTVVFASGLQGEIAGGQAQLLGGWDHQQARLVAAEISGTPLPEPLVPAS